MNLPVGSSEPSIATRTASLGPSSCLGALIEFLVNPGETALTLIPVDRFSERYRVEHRLGHRVDRTEVPAVRTARVCIPRQRIDAT